MVSSVDMRGVGVWLCVEVLIGAGEGGGDEIKGRVTEIILMGGDIYIIIVVVVDVAAAVEVEL